MTLKTGTHVIIKITVTVTEYLFQRDHGHDHGLRERFFGNIFWKKMVAVFISATYEESEVHKDCELMYPT